MVKLQIQNHNEEVLKMNKSYLYGRSFKKLLVMFTILLLICFVFCISIYAQSAGQIEIKKRIQIINPRPLFSLRLRLEKGDRASYLPGERIALSFESTKDAYVTIYQYDSGGRVKVIFPNQLSPHNFVRGGRLYQVENTISLDSGFGTGYIQGFATARPLLMVDRLQVIRDKDFPIISFNFVDFTNNLRNSLSKITPENWISGNILEYQVIQPYYASERVGRVMAISFPQGAEVYLDNQYQGASPKRIEDVQTGQHLIEFVLPGYEIWSKTIIVTSNSTAQIEAHLVPVEYYGDISLTCDQADGMVFIDGMEFGRTTLRGPFTISDIKEGYHELTVIKQGYRTWTQIVKVLGGEVLPVSIYLSKSNF